MLLAVVIPLKQHFNERSAEFDLSPQQAMALRELDEPSSMRELAARLWCDASNVTGIVDRLEARGLVERQVRPDDRRVKQLVLTQAGRALRRVHHDRLFADVPMLSRMPLADRQLLAKVLGRMLSPGA
jgi:DNA-binding MarR family transcriptional regulator